ncbi:MAG: histidine--tRNA ligase [Candidatus Buchananbacteria bacterium RBG_13_36_9]|uniref:Histidine--tRNA ligase n=1 Tax=Candidatus Buchananbacteria bacterium RBG_13_36_9 TaxID=1797530 RepID=A0A1G1XP49_9BACT|nr:MAG: histidine--tRNA ligase [Candidatus Buchananbacteria bacterium RBG_13_36_9]
MAVKKERIEKEELKIVKKTPHALRGFKDILPAEQKYWDALEAKAKQIVLDYGFEKIDLPLLEETLLFTRSVGKETDIVEKEMFSFIDRGGENVSLRPEATAQIARAYINHGMFNLPQPVRLYYIGPVFRYDRPQSGRYRQFNQFGFEALGDMHPVLDAQVILMAYNFMKELGIPVTIQINSIGCNNCRKNYKVQLVNYYKTQKHDLCEDCKERLVKNPLRLLDCKEEKCQAISEDAPQILDFICDDCKNHFVKVLEFLDEVQIPYNLNYHLVRGLDYYTKTIFEVWPASQGGSDQENPTAQGGVDNETKKGQSALGGGGRYDNLVEILGGRSTPAVGASIGLERVILKLKELNIEVPEKEKRDIFVAQLGESAKRKSLLLYEMLRREGLKVAECFAKDGLKTQLEVADKLGVKYTLILGQKELSEGTILLRDMEAGAQETINYNKVIKEVKKRLEL